jgi:hypothetical protein
MYVANYILLGYKCMLQLIFCWNTYVCCYWYLVRIYRRTAVVTGQQRMLTPLRHLILPLVCPVVRISLIFHWIIPCTWSGLWIWLRVFPFTWLYSLVLTADESVYLIWTHWIWQYWYLKWGSWRVWPVSRGCLLLRGNWSYLRTYRRSMLPYTRFCNCLLDYEYVLHNHYNDKNNEQ